MQELKAYNVVATVDVNPEVVDSLGCTEWAGYDADEVDAVLTLPLKRKWFDMIKAGIKKEEYRELREYWIKRLLTCSERFLDALWDDASVYPNSTEVLNRDLKNLFRIKHFDRLVFTLGYPKVGETERRLEFKNPKIRIGNGKPEWGAQPGKNYFVITWEE